jgi:hypothetical protein
MKTIVSFAMGALILSGPVFAAANACTSKSADVQRPLIELFTSEGCSSCPPADKWLSAQRNKIEQGELSAIAWHVDYWDQLGWKDPFSIAAATPRQRWLASQSHAQVYTPGVFLDGREWRRWGSATASSADAVSVPALTLNVQRHDGQLHADAVLSGLLEDAKLVFVTQTMARDSQVTRGENSGRLLRHDFSANALSEVVLKAGAALQSYTVELPLPAGAGAVTAFIQNNQGVILQSTQLLLDRCLSP